MPQSNLPDKDVEILLEIASKPKVRKVRPPKTYSEIDQFIQEVGVIAGRKKIPTYIIYYRYFLWKKSAPLIPRDKFFKYFKTKFEKCKTSDGVGYKISPKGFDMSPGGFFRARAQLRKEKDEKQKEST